MSVFLKPIGGSYLAIILASAAVLGLTIWAYRSQLRSSSGGWRWVAFALRIAAVLLCLIAALRPSLMIDEKKKQQSVVLFMIDSSESMSSGDEAGGRTRWEVAKEALDSARGAIDGQSKDLDVKLLRFDVDLRDYKADDPKGPDGRETDLGSMLLKAVKDSQGVRVSSIVLISDGASNGGVPPLDAAQMLRAQTIPVVTVGVGTADAGKAAKDLAARDLVAGPVVFVKNQPEIRGSISVRGFANQTIEVELFVDRETKPVDTKTIKVPDQAEAVVPVTGLKYIPETPGEKRLTLKVKHKDGEQVPTNNEVTTYLDVLKGGLKVLYVQGSDFSWEPKYLVRALDAAREIHADFRVLHEPAVGDQGLLDDSDLAPGQYDVYVLGGLPANFLTRMQIRALTQAVEQRGAGLLMLGGRSSFGPGGWAGTDLAKILPMAISPRDGQVEPDEGLKVVPDPTGLENYVTKLGPTATETARIWDAMPPIMGTNQFGEPKPSAFILLRARGARDLPLLFGMDNVGKGRVLAFGGETWPWARSFDDVGLVAHAKFWRQVILWLSRKENQGESQVKLKLDSRRVAVGQKLEVTAIARDAKNEPIKDIDPPATTVTRIGPDGKPEPVTLYPSGNDFAGPYIALGAPGEYEVATKGFRAGQEIGSDKARFMVYQDNRELENPAADLLLLKEISMITGGVSLNAEDLGKHLKSLAPEASDYVFQSEHRLWDNWPFFLIFVAVLTAEWALRKAKGWV